MSYFSVIWHQITCVLIFTFAFGSVAWAQDILVIDQNKKPVKDAVILIDQTAATPPVSSASSQPPRPAVMDQIGKQFVPHVLTIPVGTSVEFPNSDDIRHHVYSFSKAKVFELKLYSGKPEKPILFNTPGIVVLGCNIHDSMVGYIVVNDKPWWGQTDESGYTRLGNLDQLKNLPQSLLIWHPHQSQPGQRPIKINTPKANQDDIIKISITLNEPEPTHSPVKNRFQKYVR